MSILKRFEEIPHTADWSFRAFGADLPDLFANAACALFALQGARARDAAAATARALELEALDREALLVAWLSELLWLQETHHEAYPRIEIESLTATTLRARVFGVPLATLDKAIKAVTYHNLTIEQTASGWQAVVVVDV